MVCMVNWDGMDRGMEGWLDGWMEMRTAASNEHNEWTIDLDDDVLDPDADLEPQLLACQPTVTNANGPLGWEEGL